MKLQAKRKHFVCVALWLSLLACSDQNSRVATKINQDASLVGVLPLNPLQGKVITAWIDEQHSTMSTLYGNDIATRYARANSQQDYPSGSVLSLMTWHQQEDVRWFGKIPAAPKSVEFVVIGNGSDRRLSYSYQEYEGTPLKKTIAEESSTPNDRSAYLLSQRAAVMP